MRAGVDTFGLPEPVAARAGVGVLFARLLPLTGHGDRVPAAVCLVVGEHLFPLARLFEVPLHLCTAVALSAVAAATVPLAVLTGRAEWRTLVPGARAALSLHLTCAALLRSCRTPHRVTPGRFRSPQRWSWRTLMAGHASEENR